LFATGCIVITKVKVAETVIAIRKIFLTQKTGWDAKQ